MSARATLSATLGIIRAPFLVLVPVSIGLAWALANHHNESINYAHLLLVLVAALAAHISVNALNEYEDFCSGLDLRTERTPFSGGSGTLPAQPGRVRQALLIAVLALFAVIAIGIYLLWVVGPALVPLGLAGILTIVLYTRWLTRSPILCLLAPGIAFGPLMIMGSHFVLTGVYSVAAVWASLLLLFLVSNLLLLNQFPDREADRAAGRRHLLVAWGTRAGVCAFGLFLVAAYLSVALAVSLHILPTTALLALLTLPLAIVVWRGVVRHHNDTPRLVPYMAQNVLLTLTTPALLAVGIVVS